MRLVLAMLLASAFDCKTPYQQSHTVCDKAQQERVFLACVEKLPNGPERLAASGNDWDEVVGECRNAAASIACTTTYTWEERDVF